MQLLQRELLSLHAQKISTCRAFLDPIRSSSSRIPDESQSSRKTMVQRTRYFGNSVVQMQLALILPQIRLLKFITTNDALPKGAPALQSCRHENAFQIRNIAVDNVSN